MEAILSALTPGQIDFIISFYGSIAEWISQLGGIDAITIEDIML